jgi:hypothetical protein
MSGAIVHLLVSTYVEVCQSWSLSRQSIIQTRRNANFFALIPLMFFPKILGKNIKGNQDNFFQIFQKPWSLPYVFRADQMATI